MRLDLLAVILSVAALLTAGASYLSRPAVAVDSTMESAGTQDGDGRLAASTWSFSEGLFASKDKANQARIEQLEQRIAELEQRLTAKHSAGESPVEAYESVEPFAVANIGDLEAIHKDPAKAEAHLAELEARVNDFSLSELERIRAVREHYFASLMVYQDDELAQPSIDTALEIAQSTADDFVKREAWQLLSGVAGNRPELVDDFSGLAQEDADPHMRRLGIRGLQTQLFGATFQSDETMAAITETLQSIADNDSDRNVRRRAEQAVQQAERFRKAMDDPRALMSKSVFLGAGDLTMSVEPNATQ